VTGTKIEHFKKLASQTKVAHGDMLFFDDESRNRDVERSLGVLMHLVRDGVNAEAVDEAVKKWRARKGVS
jgi:magnesium-dependent phosphatase 1